MMGTVCTIAWANLCDIREREGVAREIRQLQAVVIFECTIKRCPHLAVFSFA